MGLRRIDPIQQRTGDPLLAFGHHGVRTRAWLVRNSIPAAGTGIHGRDQLEVCRESQRSFGAADGDYLIFHGLAHHFEDARAEFGEFIQKQPPL